MSEGEGSSGEECSLRIDTGRRPNTTTTTASEKSKGRGGRGKGKGRGKGSGQQQDPSGAPKIGDVVWAKVMGFNFWPAKVPTCIYTHSCYFEVLSLVRYLMLPMMM